jgi:hypothetical protein
MKGNLPVDNLPPKKRLPRRVKKELNKAFGDNAYGSWKETRQKVYKAFCIKGFSRKSLNLKVNDWVVIFYFDDTRIFIRGLDHALPRVVIDSFFILAEVIYIKDMRR